MIVISGTYDFTINQYLMRQEFMPYVFFSQPGKPGKVAIITKNENGRHEVKSFLFLDHFFSAKAIILVIFVGLFFIISIAIITRIQGTEFSLYMAWDVLYGYVEHNQ